MEADKVKGKTDFAVGFVGLMANTHAIGEAFHITSDETLSWNQIYNTIAQTLGVKLHPYHVASEFLSSVGPDYDYEGSLTGDKSVSVVFDNSKLKRIVPEFKQWVHFSEKGEKIRENDKPHRLLFPILQL